MKKLFCALTLALAILISTTALAEGAILPDPGYYFGRSYDGYMIEFDEYPKEEFDAYVKLLTEQYGMQITEEGSMGSDEYVFVEKPGVQNTEVFVSCFESKYECGMEIIVDDGVTLSALDSYKTRRGSEPGVIAWDDGRMIADPGDFLGYEIRVIETDDQTDWNYGGNYYRYIYEETVVGDIWNFIDALNESPYFTLGETYVGRSYTQVSYLYSGPDDVLLENCENGRNDSRRRNWDLVVQISSPENTESTFTIWQYPGFTVNSQGNVPPRPEPDSETCSFCNGDGKCNSCDGKGYQQFYNATQGWYQEDCSCSFGKCPYC